MPNHIHNVLTFIYTEGIDTEEARVKEIMEFIKGDKSPIDFEKIKPMPELLHRVETGNMEINGVKYRKWYNPDPASILSNNCRPLTPEELKEIEETGYQDWYDFSCREWGTKWNAYSATVEENTITFLTAWAPPLPIYVKLHELYPDVEFEFEWSDEDTGNNAGTGCTQYGKLWRCILPNGSFAAYELAFKHRPDIRKYYKLEGETYTYNEEEEV